MLDWHFESAASHSKVIGNVFLLNWRCIVTLCCSNRMVLKGLDVRISWWHMVYFGDESEGIWKVNSLCSKTKWGGFDLNWSGV